MLYVPGTGHDTLRVATNGRGFWQRVLDGTDPDFLSIDGSIPLHDLATYGSRGIAVADSGLTLRTTDGGATWYPVPTSLSLPLFGIGFADSLTAFAAGKTGLLARTTDGGGAWVPMNAPTGATLRGVKFISKFTGFVFGDGGVVLRTTNGGSSWQNTTNGFNGAVYGVAFKDTLLGWAVGHLLDANQGKQKLLRRQLTADSRGFRARRWREAAGSMILNSTGQIASSLATQDIWADRPTTACHGSSSSCPEIP